MSEIEKKLVRSKKSTSVKIKKDKSGIPIGRYFGETEANEAIKVIANQIYRDLTIDEREKLGSMSGTLHFERLLGLASRKTSRPLKGYDLNSDSPNLDRYKDASKAVGVELISDVDIEVPVIDMNLVNELMRVKRSDEQSIYIDPKGDVGTRSVKAGEFFCLSMYEFLFLMIKDEYAGVFRRDDTDDDWGMKIEFKWTNAMERYTDGIWGLKSIVEDIGDKKVKKFVLPTPFVQYHTRGGNSIKASMIDIDEKGKNGWQIKPEYARFAPLMKRKPRSDKGKKRNTDEMKADVKEIVKKQSGLARKKV
jgi:hypothetical protein